MLIFSSLERQNRLALSLPVQGRQLKKPCNGWEAVRRALGLGHVLFHDLRRTAVRNMEGAGVPRTDAMQISGHLTEATYKRYDIASEKGAIEAGRRMAKLHEERAVRAKIEGHTSAGASRKKVASIANVHKRKRGS